MQRTSIERTLFDTWNQTWQLSGAWEHLHWPIDLHPPPQKLPFVERVVNLTRTDEGILQFGYGVPQFWLFQRVLESQWQRCKPTCENGKVTQITVEISDVLLCRSNQHTQLLQVFPMVCETMKSAKALPSWVFHIFKWKHSRGALDGPTPFSISNQTPEDHIMASYCQVVIHLLAKHSAYNITTRANMDKMNFNQTAVQNDVENKQHSWKKSLRSRPVYDKYRL